MQVGSGGRFTVDAFAKAGEMDAMCGLLWQSRRMSAQSIYAVVGTTPVTIAPLTVAAVSAA